MLAYADIVFTSVFTAEIVLKVIGNNRFVNALLCFFCVEGGCCLVKVVIQLSHLKLTKTTIQYVTGFVWVYIWQYIKYKRSGQFNLINLAIVLHLYLPH